MAQLRLGHSNQRARHARRLLCELQRHDDRTSGQYRDPQERRFHVLERRDLRADADAGARRDRVADGPVLGVLEQRLGRLGHLKWLLRVNATKRKELVTGSGFLFLSFAMTWRPVCFSVFGFFFCFFAWIEADFACFGIGGWICFALEGYIERVLLRLLGGDTLGFIKLGR